MYISGLMLVQYEEPYIGKAIKSVLNIVDELVIVLADNVTSNTIDIMNEYLCDKLNVISLSNMDYTTHLECANIGLSKCKYPWILRVDADMIYDYNNFMINKIDDIIVKNTYDGIFFYAINLYGDIYHMNKNTPYKIYNVYLVKKECLKFSSNEKFPFVHHFSLKNVLYYNDPNVYPCFIWHLSYCRVPEQLLYQKMKNKYNLYVNEKLQNKLDFKNYFTEILGKNYKGSISWIEKNISNDIIPLNSKCSYPNELLDLVENPLFKIIKINDKSYCDITIANKNKTQSRNYQITLTILVRNTEQYLKQCLESVFVQTNDNWFIVIVNDFSYNGPINIDDYVDEQYLMFKNKITVYNSTQWIGLPKAHQYAISFVKTNIVGVLDSDDALEPNAIQEVLDVYNYYDYTKDEKEIFVYSNYFYCDKNLDKIDLGFSSKPTKSILNDRCASHFRTFMLSSYQKIYGYDAELVLGAVDQDLFFQLEQVAKPVFLSKYLYLYRYIGMTNTITSMRKANSYMLYISIMKNICRIYGYNKFTLKIYSLDPNDKNNFLKSHAYSLYEYVQMIDYQGQKYYFEIWNHDIYFALTKTINSELEFLLQKYLVDKNNYINECNIKWDSVLNEWILTEKSNDVLTLDSKFMITHRKITINQYFNCVYVLNLKKDVTKRERMERILSKLNINYIIFDAVYGLDHLDDYKRLCNQNYKSPGAYGYTMTMINIIKHAKQNNYKKILTLDDDVIFHNDFINKFDEYIRTIPHDWYLLFLGLSGPWTHPWINTDFKKFTFNKNFVNDLTNCDGSYAVGYDYHTYDEIISVAEKFEKPFDTAIIKHFNEIHKNKCFAFYPYLIIADTTTSDITRREDDILDNYLNYQFKYRINLDNYDLKSLNHSKYQLLYRKEFDKSSL
jgi:glycosyltransferase involved in cell wall biosynthesis